MDIDGLVQSLDAATEFITTKHLPTSAHSEADRLRLLAACDRLSRSLEVPEETLARIVFGAHQMSALTTAVRMGLFDALLAVPVSDGVDISVLTRKLSADLLLIRRILRVLVSVGIVAQKGKDHYTALRVAKSLMKSSPLLDGFLLAASRTQLLASLPDYLASTNFKNPAKVLDGPFQYAMKTELHYFSWLSTQPRLQASFDKWMGSARQHKVDWFDYFPFESKLGFTKDGSPQMSSDVLFVDVGGGHGAVIRSLKAKFPHIPGRMILQDRESVIASIGKHDENEEVTPFEIIAHDFFEKQPVRNARAYYLRTILHDWPDKEARKILHNIKDAIDVQAAHSKLSASMLIEPVPLLLIHEKVLDAETKLDFDRRYLAEIDLSMMVTFASQERTMEQWRDLLYSAGFQLVHVWAPPRVEGKKLASERLLEAVAL